MNFARTFFTTLLLNFLLAANATNIDSIIKLTTIVHDTAKPALFNNIAKLYYSLSPDTGLFYCDSAIFFASKFNNKAQKALSLKTKGVLYYFMGNYVNALNNYSQAIDICQNIGDSATIAALLNNQAIVYELIADYEKAISAHLKALKYYEKHGTNAEIARSLSNIGNVYSAVNSYQKSLGFQKLALNQYQKANDSIGIAVSYSNIAVNYSEMSNTDSALFYHKKALEIRQRKNDKRGTIISLFNIGNCYKTLGQYAQADKHYKLAKQNVTNLNDKRTETNILIAQASLLIQLKNHNTALQYLNQALFIANQYNFIDLRSDIYQNFANVYAFLNDNKNAYKYLLNYVIVNDSIQKNQHANYIAQLESKYQFEKKDQQIKYQQEKLLQQKSELNKNRAIFLLVLIILTVAVIFIIYISFTLRNKKRTNKNIEEKNLLLTQQQRSITDSIKYAQKIQQAVVPTDTMALQILKNYFLLWMPRDIVSGDFWWLAQKNNLVVVAVADCTGHGIPGAFMSMLGVAFLNEIVNSQKTIKSNIILNQLRIKVKNTLQQTGKTYEAKDGMDIALLVIDYQNMTLQYSGAHNPLYICRNNNIIVYKADRNPIGIYIKEKESFTLNTIELQPNDTLYIFTDGFIDQFASQTNEKFGSARFTSLIKSVQQHNIEQQKIIFADTLNQWRGNQQQTDDILVLGIKI